MTAFIVSGSWPACSVADWVILEPPSDPQVKALGVSTLSPLDCADPMQESSRPTDITGGAVPAPPRCTSLDLMYCDHRSRIEKETMWAGTASESGRSSYVICGDQPMTDGNHHEPDVSRSGSTAPSHARGRSE